jgi:hypothetical protein
MRPSRSLLAIGAGCAALAGCGGGGDDTNTIGDNVQVQKTIGSLTAAARAGDGKQICNEIFTPLLKQSVTKAAGHSCAKEVKSKLFAANARFDVSDVAVQGSQATVRVTDQFHKKSVITLVKQKDKWLISGVTAASGG